MKMPNGLDANIKTGVEKIKEYRIEENYQKLSLSAKVYKIYGSLDF